MSRTFGFALYTFLGTLFAVGAFLCLPVLLLTRQGRRFGERLGRVPPEVYRLARPLWIHAASVGEVLAAEPLVQRLRRLHHDVPILVTTTSLTGRATALARLRPDAVTLFPLDVAWIVERFVRRLQPTALIVVETEIWPALSAVAARHGVPHAVVSGRVSARAAARYQRVLWLVRPALSRVGVFAMQTQADAERIVSLGAVPERVHVVGNLKFAREAAAPATAGKTDAGFRALAEGSRLLVAASTHPGEERLVLDACIALWPDHPDVVLLIAPRRPERFEEVASLIDAAGLPYVRRSQVPATPPTAVRVLLLDTVGELVDVLPMATAVFVGGTIAPVGGHNVLEPAVFGKPVALGPNTANVAEAADLLVRRQAATRVHAAAELAAEWRRLLEDAELAAQMGARGRAVVAEQAAVADRTVELVEKLLLEKAT